MNFGSTLGFLTFLFPAGDLKFKEKCGLGADEAT